MCSWLEAVQVEDYILSWSFAVHGTDRAKSWRGSEVSNGVWGTSSSGCLHSCNYKMEQPSGISDGACSLLYTCSFLNMPITEILQVAFFGLYTLETADELASGLSPFSRCIATALCCCMHCCNYCGLRAVSIRTVCNGSIMRVSAISHNVLWALFHCCTACFI